MPFIKSVHIECSQSQPFPFDVPAIKYARHLDFDSPITFVIGDNGSGKSTLLETLAYRLQLPHLDGSTYERGVFWSAKKLVNDLQIEFNIERPIGFFFRAEDFGNQVNKIDRADTSLSHRFKKLEGKVSESVLAAMRYNADVQRQHVRKNIGHEIDIQSHGEAYLAILQRKLQQSGIFVLDEPESALSPTRQLSLIHQIMAHLKDNHSQFIIATHSPMLMAIPGATIYEVTDTSMQKTALEDTEHFQITRDFLNNPEAFLRHLG
jgi:predicted ATPase